MGESGLAAHQGANALNREWGIGKPLRVHRALPLRGTWRASLTWDTCSSPDSGAGEYKACSTQKPQRSSNPNSTQIWGMSELLSKDSLTRDSEKLESLCPNPVAVRTIKVWGLREGTVGRWEDSSSRQRPQSSAGWEVGSWKMLTGIHFS